MFDLFGKSNKRKRIYSDLIEEAKQRREDLFPGDGLLTLATRLENVARITEILKLGVDVNERGASQMTALHLATWQRNPDIVKLLLKHGADLEAIDEDKETPLYSAVSGLDDLPEPYRSRPLLPIVELLLQSGARPDTFSKLYITPARLTNNPDVRQRLILAEKEYYSAHPNSKPVDAIWSNLQYENEFLTHLASKNRSMGYHLPQIGVPQSKITYAEIRKLADLHNIGVDESIDGRIMFYDANQEHFCTMTYDMKEDKWFVHKLGHSGTKTEMAELCLKFVVVSSR